MSKAHKFLDETGRRHSRVVASLGDTFDSFCGHTIELTGMYLAAHWDEPLNHQCENCDQAFCLSGGVIAPAVNFKPKVADSEFSKRIEERWEAETPHHPEAILIAYALAEYLPEWHIKFGGDGDAGEDIQYALSLWIEDGKPDFVPPWIERPTSDEATEVGD